MDNGVDELIASEKAKFDYQRSRQQKIKRMFAACLLAIFFGIGVISFISLFNALSRRAFICVSVSILGLSLLSGLVEYIKIKKEGRQKAILFMLIQLILFTLMSLLTMILIDKGLDGRSL